MFHEPSLFFYKFTVVHNFLNTVHNNSLALRNPLHLSIRKSKNYFQTESETGRTVENVSNYLRAKNYLWGMS